MSGVTSVLPYSRLGCHGLFRPIFGTGQRLIFGFPVNFTISDKRLSLIRRLGLDPNLQNSYVMSGETDLV